MASVNHLLNDGTELISEILFRYRDTEPIRAQRLYAVLLLQRVWRGYSARKYLKKLHAAATMIQKHVRGYFVRKRKALYMLEYIEGMRMNFYNKNATKIQALWRGYTYRKTGLNIAKQFEAVRKMEKANEEYRKRMIQAKIEAEEEARRIAEENAKKDVSLVLFKLHHLLRTEQQEGIYSIHGRKEYSWFEQLLKSMKFCKYMKDIRKQYEKCYKELCPAECVIHTKRGSYKKPYCSRTGVHDEHLSEKDKKGHGKHAPFKSCRVPEKKYDRSLFSKEEYDVTMKHSRDFDNTKNISIHDFDLTLKMIDGKVKVPPYHINFWEAVCGVHDFDENANVECLKNQKNL